MFSDKLCHY